MHASLPGADVITPFELPAWSQLAPTSILTNELVIQLPAAAATSAAKAQPEKQAATTEVRVAAQQDIVKNVVPTTKAAGDAQAKANEAPAINQYKVQSGDTLSGIADKFGLTTQTLIWANELLNPNALKLEAEIIVPPVSGVVHTVKSGDTLLGLAERYKVEPEDITGFASNKIADPDALVMGQQLMVPRGVKPVEAPSRLASNTSAGLPPAAPQARTAPAAAPAPAPQQATGGGALQWPTYGPIYQFFSGGHKGLDISPPYGTPVYAAEGGVVTAAHYDGSGYGNMIIVDHQNGYSTVYAHLSAILVSSGQGIGRGQNIGRVGATGRATGPHLHFEVRWQGAPVNPLGLLPR